MGKTPRWIIIGTAVTGLVTALFVAVAKYYEIHRARAEAAKAKAEAERVKSPPSRDPLNPTRKAHSERPVSPSPTAWE
jgi:hypothetical protein